MIWLCRTSSSIQLHHLTTTILAILAEKGTLLLVRCIWENQEENGSLLLIESVRPVIITKWALPPLLHLVEHYIYYDTKDTKKHHSSSPSSVHSAIGYQENEAQEHNMDEENTMIQQQEVVLEIVINCAHVLYQLARAGILSQTNIVDDGIFFTLLTLAAYEPTTAPTSIQQDTQSEASSSASHHHQQRQDQAASEDEEISPALQLKERGQIIQSLAAKAISAISGQGKDLV